MRYELMISLRYLFSKKRKRFISFITIISILAVAVGVAALITVLAVMSGFDHELQKRVVGSNPHIVVEKEGGIDDYEALFKKISSVEGVKGSYPFIWGQGVLRFRERAHGVVIRSIDTENKADTSRFIVHMRQGDLQLKENSIILGNELASALGVFIGDELGIITPSSGRVSKFKVSGIFSSGMYEYDLNLAYVRLDSAARLFGMGNSISGIGVDMDNIDDAYLIKENLRQILPDTYYIRTWMDMNRNLFSALKLEKFTMFIILTLIIIVAALNIVSTLTVTATQKSKDIGILKAIGATRKNIMAIFSFQGFIIGALGVIIGAFAGIGLSFLLKKYQFVVLPRDIYYISHLPVMVKASDSFIIIAVALLISLLASIYPAYQASRLHPVDALRYE